MRNPSAQRAAVPPFASFKRALDASVWNETGASLRVRINPPWWQRWWASGGAVLAVVLILLGWHRARVSRLKETAALLEQHVALRTAELVQAKDAAELASRAKTAFLANMSHELRTPLNGVLGFAQLMARRAGRDSADRQHLATILRSGEHLLGLINDVLSVSRIEAGASSVNDAPFDLGALVQGTSEMLRARAEAKDLTLECVGVMGLPGAVLGDAGKLRQILINLLGNAVKFTEHGGVSLRAHWADGRAEFDVEDSGPGIAQDEIEKIFEPSVQAEAGRQAKEGTGLGLALSRELARLMGGNITAESEPGRGSHFRLVVSLPLASEALVPPEETRRVSRLVPGQPAWRILVVDDLTDNRVLLSGLLRSVGHEVKEAVSGEEALEIRRSFRTHFIWMDKRMPGIQH